MIAVAVQAPDAEGNVTDALRLEPTKHPAGCPWCDRHQARFELEGDGSGLYVKLACDHCGYEIDATTIERWW